MRVYRTGKNENLNMGLGGPTPSSLEEKRANDKIDTIGR